MNSDEIKKILDSLPEEELPEGFHNRLQDRLQNEAKTPSKVHTRWYSLAAGLAAVLLLFIALQFIGEGRLPFIVRYDDNTADEPGGILNRENDITSRDEAAGDKSTTTQAPEESARLFLYAGEVWLYVDNIPAAVDSLSAMAVRYNIQIESQSDNAIVLNIKEDAQRRLLYSELDKLGQIEQSDSRNGDLVTIHIIKN